MPLLIIDVNVIVMLDYCVLSTSEWKYLITKAFYVNIETKVMIIGQHGFRGPPS